MCFPSSSVIVLITTCPSFPFLKDHFIYLSLRLDGQMYTQSEAEIFQRAYS
jgi:hypothetical protein